MIPGQIVERERPLPAQLFRTLDAIHLAAALAVHSTGSEIELLSVNERIRRTGNGLAFASSPSDIQKAVSAPRQA